MKENIVFRWHWGMYVVIVAIILVALMFVIFLR